VPAGVDPTERRMREVSYLHITRYVQFLLDRKDRMSMAHGLEVRVPFCDHRLVQYVFNTPWSMKTFDGREKSLLRAATRRLLPVAIAERRKSAYPTTHNPGYDRALRAELAAIVNDPDAPVRPFLDLPGARRTSAEDPTRSTGMLRRSGLEFVVQLNMWLKTNDLELQ
jgi:asparagine synthase (glutamine-hydrolysing)